MKKTILLLTMFLSINFAFAEEETIESLAEKKVIAQGATFGTFIAGGMNNARSQHNLERTVEEIKKVEQHLTAQEAKILRAYTISGKWNQAYEHLSSVSETHRNAGSMQRAIAVKDGMEQIKKFKNLSSKNLTVAGIFVTASVASAVTAYKYDTRKFELELRAADARRYKEYQSAQ